MRSSTSTNHQRIGPSEFFTPLRGSGKLQVLIFITRQSLSSKKVCSGSEAVSRPLKNHKILPDKISGAIKIHNRFIRLLVKSCVKITLNRRRSIVYPNPITGYAMTEDKRKVQLLKTLQCHVRQDKDCRADEEHSWYFKRQRRD